jgi:hypothetical protein
MSPKLDNGGASLPLKSSAFIHSIALHSTEKAPGQAPFDLEGAINMATSRCGMTNKEMAAHQGLDASQWSKAVRGVEGHVSLGRLLQAPPAFWLEFLPLVAAHFGATVHHTSGLGQSVARCLAVMAEVVARLELHAEQQARRVG